MWNDGLLKCVSENIDAEEDDELDRGLKRAEEQLKCGE